MEMQAAFMGHQQQQQQQQYGMYGGAALMNGQQILMYPQPLPPGAQWQPGQPQQYVMFSPPGVQFAMPAQAQAPEQAAAGMQPAAAAAAQPAAPPAPVAHASAAQPAVPVVLL
jgi:hypothetical protein